MQKITPHLWFDTQAKEATEFYVSVFPNSKITSSNTIHGTPSGDTDILSFNLSGYSFRAISAGPYFKANPSISFMVNFDPSRDDQSEAHLRELWDKLSEGGKLLMPLQEYPFSKLYGWTEDRFGISWQLILTNPEGEERPFIVPSLLFTKGVSGKAVEASDLYINTFANARRGTLAHYTPDSGMDTSSVMFTDFALEGQWFAAMDGGDVHDFAFSEALSFMVNCDSQEEVDAYWEKLSAVPQAEQCGWLKDAYGVSWQIIPSRMEEMMSQGTPEQMKRVTEAFLKMKKFDIAKLEEAFAGESE